MPAYAEMASLSPAQDMADRSPVGLIAVEQSPKLPNYSPLARYLESKVNPDGTFDLAFEEALSARWDYEYFLEKAQIGERKGPLYNRFRAESDNRNKPKTLEEMIQMEARVQTRIDAEALSTIESKQRANEELEKIRKIDPVFADLLKEQFEGKENEDITPQNATGEQRITEPVEIINFEVVERESLAA